MTSLMNVFVPVRAELGDFEPDLRRKLAGVDASRSGRKVGDSFASGFGQSTKRIVGLAAGVLAGVKVKNFLLESTQGYRDHAKVAKITAQVIKTTGGAAKVSTAQVGALSDAIERKTGVDGDAIQSGANLLLTFTNVRNEAGKGNQIFDRSTALLADMSVALGQDAKGSAIQLGKALNDPVKGVTALSKVGVSFTEQQKKQIKTLVESGNVLAAQKIILNELGKEFGGAAKAAADPADRAKVSYHQLQDEIGSVTLPVVNQLSAAFADRLAPVLLDIAEKKGPGVRKFFLDVLPSMEGIVGILSKGDFSKPIFGQQEDSKFVDYLFRVRESLQSIHGAFDILAKGDFTGQIFGQGEDSKTVDVLFRIRDAIGGLGDKVKGIDKQELKELFSSALDSASKLLPVIRDFIAALPGFGDVIKVSVQVLGFLADHTETLRKLIPYLVAGIVAYKIAQAAANIASAAAVPTKIAEVVVNRQLVKSNRELIASRAAATVAQVADTVASGAGTVATEANTVATNTNATATIRQRVAALASSAATKAVAAATAIWTGAQWLLNAALTANPIGLIIVGIAALVAGLVLAYKKSETFRAIVDGAFHAVQAAAAFAFNWVKTNWPLILGIITGPIGLAVLAVSKSWQAIRDGARTALAFVVDKFLGFVETLVDGAAKAFGWVPGLGGKLKDAAKHFGEFRDQVNNRLAGIKDQDIKFTIKYTNTGVNLSAPSSVGRSAEGGKMRGPGTDTSDSIMRRVSNNEWVIKAKSSRKYGDYAMASVNAGTATIIPGLADGGKAGLSIRGPLPPSDAFTDSIASAARRIATPVARAAAKEALGSGAPGGIRRFRGVTLNDGTIRKLLAAEQMLHRVFHITQGSYSTRVAASGSTHAGGGVMDTNGPGGWDAAVRALRRAGFAAWHRTPAQGPWGHHIHSVSIGDPTASPAARAQVRDYLRGGDGLAGMYLGGKVLLRDKGGVLPPGMFAFNGTSRNETVLPGGAAGVSVQFTGCTFAGTSKSQFTDLVVGAVDEAKRKRRI